MIRMQFQEEDMSGTHAILTSGRGVDVRSPILDLYRVGGELWRYSVTPPMKIVETTDLASGGVFERL